MSVFLMVLGLVCILYYACVGFMAGHGTNFYYIWLVMGLVFLAWGIAWKRGMIKKVPVWIRRLTMTAVILGGCLFLFVEGLIVSRCFEKGKPDLDYIVVLGAYLRPTGPSTVLQYRLDEAYDYYLANPDVKIVVSGGQGTNEPKPEADGMAEYLMELGVPKESILIENQSKNTTQNLAFSAKLIDEENASVGIVTNNFHVFRATQIAKAAGYNEVYGIAARSYPFLQPQNMLREFFGVVKDFIFGNM
ncbi:MAG: YdcF family protein [Lachnospiraceae bacterium]|nr:YdcF family protein [Lachnospiraceae bacterium]MBQ7360820.1 YdcF family protein [Lachnospiraceae bacterium]